MGDQKGKTRMQLKLPPLLSRKLEEIKRRRAGTNFSRKKLLCQEDLSTSCNKGKEDLSTPCDQVNHSVEVKEEVTTTIKETDETEHGKFSNEEGNLVFPSSPSFRIYYLESLQSMDYNSDSSNVNSASTSTEESADKAKKREHKGRRFVRVGIPVKNILNVRSCASGGHSRLISSKSATL